MTHRTEQPGLPAVTRRRLLRGSAAALGLLAGGGIAAGAHTGSKESAYQPGVQLYSVRASMEADMPRTLKAIAGIGYRAVEFAGYFNHSPREVKAMLDDFGLSAPATHMDARQLRDDPLPLVEAAAEIGHRCVVLAWLHPDDRLTIGQYRAWAEHCNRLGALCRDHGMRFGYHNHDFEFTPLDGVVPYDVLLEGTDPELVDFELDFFWVRKAGLEVVPTLARAPGRFAMAHIKDIDAAGNMVDVGEGLIDFAAILADPAARALRHLFVEHDEPTYPFRSIAASHYAMQRILRDADRTWG
jgi:sugar phosphate isomerase/epimerase